MKSHSSSHDFNHSCFPNSKIICEYDYQPFHRGSLEYPNDDEIVTVELIKLETHKGKRIIPAHVIDWLNKRHDIDLIQICEEAVLDSFVRDY